MSERPLQVLGAASSAGAYGPGQERAPHALRERGLVDALSRGRRVTDGGDVASGLFGQTGGPFNNAAEVLRVTAALAAPVGTALAEGKDLLVLGGDCTIELGVVAGALRHTMSVGLVYVDLDADLTTSQTGDGILDWMGVAHLLGLEDTYRPLAGIGPRRPLLAAEDLALVAVDRATDDERGAVERLGLAVESLDQVRKDMPGTLSRLSRRFAAHDVVLVHVDVDVLRRRDLPVADNDRDVDGLSPDELEALLVALMGLPRVRALTLTEVNPERPDVDVLALDRLIHMVVGACG